MISPPFNNAVEAKVVPALEFSDDFVTRAHANHAFIAPMLACTHIGFLCEIDVKEIILMMRVDGSKSF